MATCLKSPFVEISTGSLFQLVLRNLRNPIHSLYTWPTVVSDIGKPLKLPATTILAPTKKKVVPKPLWSAVQAIFKQIPATKVCGNTKESFEEISESSELPPPVELQSQVWLPRLNRSESVWNKHKYKQTKTKNTHTVLYLQKRLTTMSLINYRTCIKIQRNRY